MSLKVTILSRGIRVEISGLACDNEFGNYNSVQRNQG
jgi:hypothetical protein